MYFIDVCMRPLYFVSGDKCASFRILQPLSANLDETSDILTDQLESVLVSNKPNST